MADSSDEQKPKKPPKIKLNQPNGNGLAKPTPPGDGPKDTARIDLSDAKASPAQGSAADTERIDLPKPPKIRSVKKDTEKNDSENEDTKKEDTAKVDLSEARSESPPDDTIRIDVPGAKKSETAKISLEDARPAEPSADTPAEHEETQPVSPDEAAKEDTSRVQLEDAKAAPAKPEEAASEAAGAESISEEEYEELRKQSTMRVDLGEDGDEAEDEPTPSPDAAGPAPTTEESEDVSKSSTEPVALGENGDEAEDEPTPSPDMAGPAPTAEESEDVSKPSTDREDEVKPKPDAVTAARNQTMRVQLDEGDTKPPRQETAKIDVPPSAPAAEDDGTQPVGTHRIEMDQEPSSDDVFKRRSSEGPEPGLAAAAGAADADGAGKAAEQNKTARVDVQAEAEKSKTARIEVPQEMAAPQAGRPKTIRIKRSESTAGPVQVPDAVKESKKKPKKGKAKPSAEGEPAEAGTLYSVLALVSVIVMGMLVYVLAAQTIAPGLSWIGKIPM